jgi:cytochrome c-type biogenesis protein CcmE
VSKGLQIAVGAALVAALLGWYSASRLEGGSFVYYQSLDEFRAAGHPGAARVHGYVIPGSIERDVPARVVRFSVQNDPPHARGRADDALRVVYASLETPDLFKDGAEVVVEGELAPDAAEFHATNVLAKCPSKFQARAAGTSL